MNASLVLPKSVRSAVLYLGVGAVFALGCNTIGPPTPTDVAVETTSCVEGALSMSFDVVSTNGMLLASYQFGSPNVVGIPTIVPGTNMFHVTANVDTLALGEQVSMNFTASVFMNASIGAQNIQYYTVPASQLPQPSACPPADGPVIGTNDGPGLGFHLTVSNPTGEPMILQELELAESSSVLPSTALAWGNSALEALPWTSAMGGGTVLAPGAPPIVIDLPDVPSPSTHATLLRYVAIFHGDPQRTIIQADLIGGTVTVTPTTWGKVKALYR